MLIPTRLYVINHFTSILPPTKLYRFKALLYRWCGVKIGINVRLVSSVNIWGTGKLIIDDNTFIGHDSLIILGGSSIYIGKNVDISSRVTIVNGTHKKSISEDKAAGIGISLDITIDNGCWLGLSSTVLAGCHIGKNSIIAAGALVNKDVETNTIVGGIPAKEINNE